MSADSPAQTLRTLPALVSGAELMRARAMSPASRDTTIHRLVKSGLLRRAGTRLDLFYNLVRDETWEQNLRAAVGRLVPSGVLIGALPLYEAGWVTQHPRLLDIAAMFNARGARAKIDGAEIFGRPGSWYRSIGEMGAFESKTGADDLRVLKPAWALADALLYSHQMWLPSPNEIDLDISGRLMNELKRAFVGLRLMKVEEVSRFNDSQSLYAHARSLRA